jgi:hypothetical protein
LKPPSKTNQEDAFPLIEEKTGFGFFRLNEKTLRPLRKRCAVARTVSVSRQGRNENATLATYPHNHKVSGIKNNLVPL